MHAQLMRIQLQRQQHEEAAAIPQKLAAIEVRVDEACKYMLMLSHVDLL